MSMSSEQGSNFCLLFTTEAWEPWHKSYSVHAHTAPQLVGLIRVDILKTAYMTPFLQVKFCPFPVFEAQGSSSSGLPAFAFGPSSTRCNLYRPYNFNL